MAKKYLTHQKHHSEVYEKIADEWEDYERRYYKTHSKICMICGEKKNVDLHHILPRHICPLKIFDVTNLIPLHRPCHFIWGHLLNWHDFNPDVIKDSVELNKLIKIHKEYYLQQITKNTEVLCQ